MFNGKLHVHGAKKREVQDALSVPREKLTLSVGSGEAQGNDISAET